jgi:hypothetical protein
MERKIYAVHDRDLKQFLTELNLLDEIVRCKIRCPECDCKITLENIGFIYFSKGEAKICCDDIECFYKLETRKRRKKEDEETTEEETEVVQEIERQSLEPYSNVEETQTDET